MEPPKGCTVERIEEMPIGDLASDPLSYAAGRSPHPGSAFHILIAAADGGSEVAELLYFEATNRAGVAWSSRDWWLDAASGDEALLRWLQGAGKLSSARSPESGNP
jgi:hypothetical protein